MSAENAHAPIVDNPNKVRTASLLVRITGVAIFIQMALGGLLTFGYIPADLHMAFGVILLLLTILAVLLLIRAPSRFRTVRFMLVGVVLLIVVQGVLGFVTISTGNNLLAWVHLIVAIGIYGMNVSASVMIASW